MVFDFTTFDFTTLRLFRWLNDLLDRLGAFDADELLIQPAVEVRELVRVEAHLLDALACRDLGDERAARAAAERALHLAEPDRLILPFAMTGAWELLTALPPQGTSHSALVADILDAAGFGQRYSPAPIRRSNEGKFSAVPANAGTTSYFA